MCEFIKKKAKSLKCFKLLTKTPREVSEFSNTWSLFFHPKHMSIVKLLKSSQQPRKMNLRASHLQKIYQKRGIQRTETVIQGDQNYWANPSALSAHFQAGLLSLFLPPHPKQRVTVSLSLLAMSLLPQPRMLLVQHPRPIPLYAPETYFWSCETPALGGQSWLLKDLGPSGCL